jgi:hypothetical protein
MKNALLLFLALGLFASCDEFKDDDKKEEAKERKLSTSDELSIGEPLNYGLDSMLVFPIGRAYYEAEVKEDEDKKKRSRRRGRAKSSKVEFIPNTGLRPYDQMQLKKST